MGRGEVVRLAIVAGGVEGLTQIKVAVPQEMVGSGSLVKCHCAPRFADPVFHPSDDLEVVGHHPGHAALSFGVAEGFREDASFADGSIDRSRRDPR